MALTKLQARTAIQQLFDDPLAALWSPANLDILTGFIYDELWSLILNNAPYYVSQLDTLTTLTTPGFFDVRLVADGGSLSKRFHRLQNIVRGGRSYSKLDPRDIVVEANSTVVAADFKYAFYGDQVWLFPLDTAADVEVRYSFKPAAFTSLTDGDAISWPDGHDSAFIFEVAARAMLRGEREDSSRLAAIASRAQDEMLTMVKKRQHFMSVGWTPDSPVEFGGI